jgi:hypothetical protein
MWETQPHILFVGRLLVRWPSNKSGLVATSREGKVPRLHQPWTFHYGLLEG